eukprot:2588674-Rhodomonas_salina.1
MSGTDIAYGGISLRACYAMSGTHIAYGCAVQPGLPWMPRAMPRRDAWYRPRLCPVLTEGTLIPGKTDKRQLLQNIRDVTFEGASGYVQLDPQECGFLCLISECIGLRARYPMSGTAAGIACGAVSGTGIANSATCLRECYAMSGTDIADGGARASE